MNEYKSFSSAVYFMIHIFHTIVSISAILVRSLVCPCKRMSQRKIIKGTKPSRLSMYYYTKAKSIVIDKQSMTMIMHDERLSSSVSKRIQGIMMMVMMMEWIRYIIKTRRCSRIWPLSRFVNELISMYDVRWFITEPQYIIQKRWVDGPWRWHEQRRGNWPSRARPFLGFMFNLHSDASVSVLMDGSYKYIDNL